MSAGTFEPCGPLSLYETRDMRADFGGVSVHVTGQKRGGVKVFACFTGGLSCSLTMTADQARALAAELIASADSTARVAA